VTATQLRIDDAIVIADRGSIWRRAAIGRHQRVTRRIGATAYDLDDA
jgi:hypothetical protein